jgi:hypothetical protein
MPTNKLEHNPHVAGLYRAIALRFYCRYVDMRDSASCYGADLADHGKLPTAREASDQYVAAVEEWVWEAPDTADAALALVDFAGIIGPSAKCCGIRCYLGSATPSIRRLQSPTWPPGSTSWR